MPHARRHLIAFLGLATLVLGSLTALPAAAAWPLARAGEGRHGAPRTVPADMPAFIRRYSEDRGDILRFYASAWSETRLDRLTALHRERQEALKAIDFNTLDQQGRIDYLLMRNTLRNADAYNDLDRRRLAEMDPLLPFRPIIRDLEERRWRMERTDARAASLDLAQIPAQIKAIRERLEKGRQGEARGDADADPATSPLSVGPVIAQRAAAAVASMRSALRWWYDYHAQFEPGFAWWVEKPHDLAQKSLDEYAAFLRREVAGLKGQDDDPLIGDPIGRDTLLQDLRNECIPYSPEDLIRIGEREFAWCEDRMKEAAAEMGLADDWRAALERTKNSYVDPGEQTHECTRIVREQIEFLTSRDLLTIPDLTTELWRLEMITPERQKFWPFQYYGGLHIGVGYASDRQSVEERLQAMRGNNRHFTRIVVPHELIPGHHLQGHMAARHRPYRRAFSTPFFLEGWCLYWEMKLWDLGWARSPEDRVGMLFWRMHRAARIIISLRFHLGLMSPAEMIDFLTQRVGHEKNNAVSEVRRYIGGDYSPLYQCGYLLGGIQIRALHQEAVGTGRMAERPFNDTILTMGTIPVEFIRAAVLDIPLSPDHEASWMFAGSLQQDQPADR